MQVFEPIVQGKFYHIFHQGINGEHIFRQEKNYYYFLRKYHEYTHYVADTLAYCLLKNQFNLLIYVKDFKILNPSKDENRAEIRYSSQFRHFLNAYAQAFNKMYHRRGGLFVTPFRRCEVCHPHLEWTIFCIHANAQHHGLIRDFRKWPYSSYQKILEKGHSIVNYEWIWECFGGELPFLEFHESNRHWINLGQWSID